jgi:hypothetical protein
MKTNTKKEVPSMFFDGLACSDETTNEFMDYVRSEEFLDLGKEEQIVAVLDFGSIAGSFRISFNEKLFILNDDDEWEDISQK